MNEPSARARAVFQRTYSRPLENGKSETFEQVMDRVVSHQRWLWARALGDETLTKLSPSQEAELEEFRKLLLQRKAVPAGRTLWLGGTEIARTREISQFNCSGLVVETVFDYVDTFWALLNGAGVGARPVSGCLNGFMKPIHDVRVIRSQRTEKGGRETNLETWDPKTKTWTLSIGDSGESWAKAAGKLLAGKYPADTLVFDFSELRPEGSMLSRYGWRSSGDSVISQEFPRIARLLSRRAGQLLSKLDIGELVNILGVIQTGRRGAEILLMEEGDPETEDFIRFKAGCWSDPELAHRAQSNNSLLFYERPTRERLEEIFAAMVASGGNEPGFINAEAARIRAPFFSTMNPCAEILLANRGLCNLVEVCLPRFQYLDDLLRALWVMARANYRQTLVSLNDSILQRSWEENNQFLRLCGVSLTGITQRPDLTPHDYRAMRTSAQMGAWSMADELGTPRPKNVTTIKPSGTASKGMDCAEGAHKPLGRYVFNSILYQRSDPMVSILKNAGYEVRMHPTAETQVLVKFPVETKGVIFEDFNGTPVNLEPAVSQLERYRMLMTHYVDQNCSMTISYDPEEVPQIIDWLERHWHEYVGVSFAFRTDPTKTAADFGATYLPQAVVTEQEFREYTAGLKPIDWDAELGGAVELELLDEDCATGVCPIR